MEDLNDNSVPNESDDYGNDMPDGTLECFVEDSNRGVDLDEARVLNEIGVNIVDGESGTNEPPTSPPELTSEIPSEKKPIDTVNWPSTDRTYPPEETWEYRIGNQDKSDALFAEQALEAERTYDIMRGASIEMDPMSGPIESALDIASWRTDVADKTSAMGQGWDEYVAGLPEPYTDPYPPPESDSTNSPGESEPPESNPANDDSMNGPADESVSSVPDGDG